MSARHPVARRARLGLDKRTTEVVVAPRLRIVTIAGVRGVWVPIHPLAEITRR
jgi:hypothetical protein